MSESLPEIYREEVREAADKAARKPVREAV